MAEIAKAGQVACLISCGAACVLAVVMMEVPGVARRRVETLQAAMLADVAARFRKDGKRHGASAEPVAQSRLPGARAQEAAELRVLAEEGRALCVRLGESGSGEAQLADDMARAVAFWERRARWALRGHRIEWVAFGGPAGHRRFAVTFGSAKDRVAAQVRLLLSVAGELEGTSNGGDGQVSE